MPERKPGREDEITQLRQEMAKLRAAVERLMAGGPESKHHQESKGTRAEADRVVKHRRRKKYQERDSQSTLYMDQFAPERFCKYYVRSLEEGEKRKINPFSVYEDIQEHLRG